jgi:arginine decarboxylase
MSLLPTKAYLSSGVGRHPHELVAFELALRDAGVAAQNLVPVSSILPPGCPLVSREEGEAQLQSGQILHVVMSRAESCEGGRTEVASIGIARPVDSSAHGFVAEHDAIDRPVSEVEATVVELAGTMLASSLGVLPEEAGDPGNFSAFGEIEETRCISAEARCEKDGQWTVAVALCILLIEN